MGEKSFVPKVLEKETEIDAMLSDAQTEAEQLIRRAEHDAQQHVRDFEKQAPGMIKERYDAEIALVRDEAGRIEEAGRIQAQQLKEKAVERVDRAVEEIVRAVLPIPLIDEEEDV